MIEQLEQLFTPKSLDYYSGLTRGGECNISLNQQEAAVALKTHDYGVEYLSEDELLVFYSLVAKLKDQIWP